MPYGNLKCLTYSIDNPFEFRSTSSGEANFEETNTDIFADKYTYKVDKKSHQDIYMLSCVIRYLWSKGINRNNVILDYRNVIGLLKTGSDTFDMFDNDSYNLDNLNFYIKNGIYYDTCSFSNQYMEEMTKKLEIMQIADNLRIKVGDVLVKVFMEKTVKDSCKLITNIRIEYKEKEGEEYRIVKGTFYCDSSRTVIPNDYIKKCQIEFSEEYPEGILGISKIFTQHLDTFSKLKEDSIVSKINSGLVNYELNTLVDCAVEIINNPEKHKNNEVFINYAESDDPCCICQCDNDDVKDFKGVERKLHMSGLKFKCGHHTCSFCLLEYMKKSKRNTKCPMCRSQIKVEDTKCLDIEKKSFEEVSKYELPPSFIKEYRMKLKLADFKIDKEENITFVGIRKFITNYHDDMDLNVARRMNIAMDPNIGNEEDNFLLSISHSGW